MARADEREGTLRGCPVCETPIADTTSLGLRDFSWVNQELDNKLGLMDLDGFLSQYKTGRMLVLELKPARKPVMKGARLSFATLVRAGVDVWVIWDQGDGTVVLGECNDNGFTPKTHTLTVKETAVRVRDWWDEGLML
jgi:hypothetical protein